MRKFIIREDTIKKVREGLKGNKDVLHDFDTGLPTLSPYMPTHLDLGNEDCCGIFMAIAEDNRVICNECGLSINKAIELYGLKPGDTVKVCSALKGAPDEIHKIIRNTDGKLALDDVMGTALDELKPESIKLNWKNKYKGKQNKNV